MKPLVFVATWKVKEGKVEDLERYYRKVVDIIEANEPRVIAFHGFLNEDGTELTSIQVHPDAASMEFHMQVLRENWDESFSEYNDWVEGGSFQYYGDPPESARAMDREIGVPVGHKPRHIAGFTRTSAA